MSVTQPGFGDAVLDAQECFRAVLAAMAEPGTVHRVAEVVPPPPLDAATAAVLLTLVDGETGLHVDHAAMPAGDWVRFHTGAPAAVRAEAAFALMVGPLALDELLLGEDEVPEASATAIVQVASLEAGEAYRLHGPGILNSRVVRVTGLPAQFVAGWAANHALFPRGIDLILCAGDRVMALPRSAGVEAG